jgi:hypothetical protein
MNSTAWTASGAWDSARCGKRRVQVEHDEKPRDNPSEPVLVHRAKVRCALGAQISGEPASQITSYHQHRSRHTQHDNCKTAYNFSKVYLFA